MKPYVLYRQSWTNRVNTGSVKSGKSGNLKPDQGKSGKIQGNQEKSGKIREKYIY